MNIVLPLHCLEKTLGPGWLQPLALMPLADSTVLGQVLHSALQAGAASATFPTRAGEGEIAGWVASACAQLEATFLTVQQAADGYEASHLTSSQWQDRETLFVSGDAVIDADLAHLDGESFDIVCLAFPAEEPDRSEFGEQDGRLGPFVGEQPGWQVTGTWWFRTGRLLADALASYSYPDQREMNVSTAVAFQHHLLNLGYEVGVREVRLYLPLYEVDEEVARPEALLAANGRLLRFGRSDSDAIERSYSEEFTVVPPVFIDNTAVIEGSVIGSQTSIAPGAVVRNSVVSHCIIGPEATIENAVIEHALIGEQAAIIGTAWTTTVPDHTRVVTGHHDKGQQHDG